MVGRDPTPYIQPEVSSSDEEGDLEDLRASGGSEAAPSAEGGWPGDARYVVGPAGLPDAGAEQDSGEDNAYRGYRGMGVDDGSGVRARGRGGSSGPPLTFDVQVDRQVFEAGKAHNTWGLVTVEAVNSGFTFGLTERVGIDLALVVDTSGSMRLDSKLASVQATIEYILDVLSERDRLALVAFSDEAVVLFELQPMVAANKAKVLEVLHQMKAEGNTNLSDGLFKGLDLLLPEASPSDTSGVFRIPRLFLLTDGLATRGLAPWSLLNTLSEREMPENLSIQCFGYGSDHSSSLLQSIAFRSPGGLYFFVQDSDSIAGTFGECLGGIFSTVAHSVKVEVEAFDGCRLIQFKTKCPVEPVKVMKNYIVRYGCVYEQERRSTVVSLSLRALRAPREQKMLRVTLSYVSVLEPGKVHTESKLVTVMRRKETAADRISPNLELDKQLNRIYSAEAIDKALALVSGTSYGQARDVLLTAIARIQTSVSCSEPFCLDLVADLRECLCSMEDREYFVTTGVHDAHGYSTMYNQERSVGPGAATRRTRRAGRGYGYHTTSQLEEAKNATSTASGYLSGYLMHDTEG